jgi:hypothetical protein
VARAPRRCGWGTRGDAAVRQRGSACACMCTGTRLQTDAPGVEQRPNGGGSARRGTILRTPEHGRGTACPMAVWLAPACVCRRETLDGELQAGRKKATTQPCTLSTEVSMVKGEALVGFLGAARTTMKHQSGGAAFSLPACSHRRISAPGGARAWLSAPKGDAS